MSHANHSASYIQHVRDAKTTDTLKLMTEGPDNTGHNYILMEGMDSKLSKKYCGHFYQGMGTKQLYDENGKEDGEEKYLIMAWEHPTTPEQHRQMMLLHNNTTLKEDETEGVNGTIGTKGKGLKDLMWNLATRVDIYSRDEENKWSSRIWNVGRQEKVAYEERDKNPDAQKPMNHIGSECTSVCPPGKWSDSDLGNEATKIFVKKFEKKCEQNVLPKPQTFVIYKLREEKMIDFENDDLEQKIIQEYERKYCYNKFDIHYFKETKDDDGDYKYEMETLSKVDNVLRNDLQDKMTFYVKICGKKSYFYIEHNEGFKYFIFKNDRDRNPGIKAAALDEIKKIDKNWTHGKDNCTFSITFGNVQKARFNTSKTSEHQKGQGVYYFMKEHDDDDEFCALLNRVPQSISEVFDKTGRHGNLTTKFRVLINIIDKANGWKIQDIKVDTRLPQNWKKYCKSLLKHSSNYYKTIWATAELRDIPRPLTVPSKKTYEILKNNEQIKNAAQRKKDNKTINRKQENQKFYAQLFIKEEPNDDDDDEEGNKYTFTTKVGITSRKGTIRQQENEKKCKAKYGTCEASFEIAKLPTGCNLKLEDLIKRFFQEVENDICDTVVEAEQITDKCEIFSWTTWEQLNTACMRIKNELWNSPKWREENFMKILTDIVVGEEEEDDLEEKVEN